MLVTRTLPNKGRRMVGAWCFLDAYGPEDLASRAGMRVPPHPHIGLQTVSWLVAGEVEHRDSLGNHRLVRPGELSIMTAGRGIAHSEMTPSAHSPVLHGVQLWVAMPDPSRDVGPAFAHHADLPVLHQPGVRVTVFAGAVDGATSPAGMYTPIVGAEVVLATGAQARLPLETGFEHAVLVVSGTASIDGEPLATGPLLYLGTGRPDLVVAAPDGPATLLLLGGEPFGEAIVMWWNFVARDHDEIVVARADWEGGAPRFGVVPGDAAGVPLPAPPMPISRLMPRRRVPSTAR
jgi:redox-sensitive bicupin YhaK (pirin superfamily)